MVSLKKVEGVFNSIPDTAACTWSERIHKVNLACTSSEYLGITQLHILVIIISKINTSYGLGTVKVEGAIKHWI